MEESEKAFRLAIEKEFRGDLQSYYEYLLERHNIRYGDITLSKLTEMREAEENLARVISSWVYELRRVDE